MIRRISVALVGLFAVTLASSAVIGAHEGHAHKIMGTVTMAATDHVMLKDTSGKDVVIHVTKDTKVKSKPPMKVEDIKPGTRVVVTAMQEKDTFEAETIEVGTTAAAKK